MQSFSAQYVIGFRIKDNPNNGASLIVCCVYFEVMILQRTFYQRDILEVSRELLGKILVHQTQDGITAGRIVETEAYAGPEDRAAHSYGGRKTPRNAVMFGEKGHAYVYLIYGMYYCVNMTAGVVAGKPEAVLIRALEPVEGQELMAKRRGYPKGKVATLTNGPGRLCMALGITKVLYGADLTAPPFYIKDAQTVSRQDIVETSRVGIDYAGAWVDKPWRFYIKGNGFISKP
jgi:DNA-3-methyladenine glycosylase